MLIMGLVVGGCMTAGMLIMFPRKAIRRMAGYMLPSDAALSTYGVSSGIATGTVSGMLGGFIAAIGLSLGLRARAAFTGAEKLAVNGDDSARAVASAAMSQASRWVRSSVSSLWKGGNVVAPPAYAWEWIEMAPAHTMSDLGTEIMGFFTHMRLEILDF